MTDTDLRNEIIKTLNGWFVQTLDLRLDEDIPSAADDIAELFKARESAVRAAVSEEIALAILTDGPRPGCSCGHTWAIHIKDVGRCMDGYGPITPATCDCRAFDPVPGKPDSSFVKAAEIARSHGQAVTRDLGELIAETAAGDPEFAAAAVKTEEGTVA